MVRPIILVRGRRWPFRPSRPTQSIGNECLQLLRIAWSRRRSIWLVGWTAHALPDGSPRMEAAVRHWSVLVSDYPSTGRPGNLLANKCSGEVCGLFSGAPLAGPVFRSTSTLHHRIAKIAGGHNDCLDDKHSPQLGLFGNVQQVKQFDNDYGFINCRSPYHGA